MSPRDTTKTMNECFYTSLVTLNYDDE